ncbi:hypothetical protein [Actinoplanes sp. RD1]|uniref:hypothetical protein n=1 Tax=Actinoplanes sp. RD1 TaxID=3064538 RepID=UPI0027410C32|nr:hypothetical protein [Actinoplanes sp. RD1]
MLPLTRALTSLAETPDEAPDVDDRLALIARLTVDLVGAADFAPITGLRDGSYLAAGESLSATARGLLDDAR